MINSPEKTDPAKITPPKHNRFWLKFTILISIILFLVWLIPYQFSNFFFKTPIQQVFSNLTQQQYSLSFEDLKINILNGKILFYDTDIKSSENTDTTNRPNILYHSDILMFQSVDIAAWKNKRILKFRNIRIEQLNLELETKNNLADSQNKNLPLSNYFKELQVKNFQISNAKINYKQNNDSIYIPALSFEIYELRIDSLSDTVKNKRFHYADFDLSLKKQAFLSPDKSHLISWKSLKLSTREKYFEFDSLNIKPADLKNNQQSYTADIPKFSLTHFEFDSLIDQKQLLAKKLFLELNALSIGIKKASQTPLSKEQLYALFKENFNKISIENSKIGINKIEINFPNNQLSFSAKSALNFDNFNFDPEKKSDFTFDDAAITLNDFLFNNPQNNQKLQLEQIKFNYDKNSLSILGINYTSPLDSNLKLQLKEFRLENIDWDQLLNTDKLLADNLYLKGGDFVQLRSSKTSITSEQLHHLDSLLLPVIKIIKIDTIHIEDWNYRHASKGLDIKNVNVQLRQFQLPGDVALAIGNFSAFDTKISQLSWISKDNSHHYVANNIESFSETHKISIEKIQSFPRWKSLKNKIDEESAHFEFLGENIKIITQKPFHKIKLNDSLILSHLSIDSINLNKYGKNKRSAKAENNFPPILIYSFELGNSQFSAYKDQSKLNPLTQINGIHLLGDSLLFLNDSLPYVSYKHLLATTKKGAYQNKLQGLSFDFEKLDFNSKEEVLGIYQLKADLNSQNKEKPSQHKFNSKLVQIKGFDHNRFLQYDLISARELIIDAPSVISKSSSNTSQSPTDFRQLFSAENIQQLPYLEFDHFVIRDFAWLATNTAAENTSITSIKKANLEIKDFRLDYQSFKDPERLFFSKSINFQIENLKQHIRNGNYILSVDHIGFSSLQKQLDFTKIQFYTLQKAKQNNYNFTIDQIFLNDISFADYQNNYSLSIESVSIDKPLAKLHLFGSAENSGIKNLNTLELYPFIKPYFSFINIRTIDVKNMSVDLETPEEKSTNTYNFGQINLQMQNLKLDSTTSAFQNNRFFYSENTLVHLRNYSASIANGLYHFEFKNLNLSTQNRKIEIDSIYLKPQYNYADFAQQVQHQTDRFDIEISSVKLSGIDFQEAIFKQKYKIRHSQINKLKGEAYRNGLYPRRANYFPLNPLQRLLALPNFIEIDSLVVNNSYFSYKELGENTNTPGHIFFDKMNAQILNATNNPVFIKTGGHTTIKADALLMGKSMLNLDVIFPLLDQGKSFHLDAHLNQIHMDDLDPILRPLALIQAQSGIIKSIDLSVDANDDYAYGEMLMLYDDMKVEVLNKWMEKGIIVSFLANALIKSENPSYLIPRKGPIYFERNKNRSLFNYWAEIGILGMRTSIGLADRRTARKVKKLKKGKL